MRGCKVVTAGEMARIEALAIERGANQEELMRQAAARVVEAALDLTNRRRLPKQITLFAWKGNKSGDAFAAGLLLLEEGFEVECFHFAPLDACTPLCRQFAETFRKKKGRLIRVEGTDPLPIEEGGVLIDGLLGTGFQGEVKEPLRFAIEEINRSHRTVLSIDIPSGLNSSTGEIGGVAVQADLTAALGLPKIGCFLKEGWNYVGELQVGEIGLPKEALEEASPSAYLADREALVLPKIVRNRHKYQAGMVVGLAGSHSLTGAAKLSTLAALRGGAGLVKLFYMPAAAFEIAAGLAPEVIAGPWEEDAWELSLQKAKAVYLGPGIGRTQESRSILERIVKTVSLPTVIDGDALQPWLKMPAHSVCTPHRGEMLRLLEESSLDERSLHAGCQRFCDQRSVIVLLKGAPTWVFIPHQKPILCLYGDPGMATAGSGDVLTGLIAALLAQGCKPEEAAILGAVLHGLAGMAAAKAKTSYCMIAGDLIESLPEVFCKLL